MKALALVALGHSARADRVQSCLAHPVRTIITAFRALLSGQSDEAFFALVALDHEDLPQENEALHAIALLTLALAAGRVGREDMAASAANRATTLLRNESNFAPLMLFPRQDLIALQQILRGRLFGFMQEAIDRRRDRVDVLRYSRTTSIPQLTGRERDVIAALANHTSVTDIAVALGISRNTAKVHLRTAYRKLGVSARAEAIYKAAELGVVIRRDTSAQG